MTRFFPVTSFAMVASVVLVGCATAPDGQPDEDVPDSLPEWVAKPASVDGISSTECIPWSGDLSMDREEAVAKARANLAKKIEIKVKAMNKIYMSKTSTTKGIVHGGVFESVSRQVAEQYLGASQPNRMELVKVGRRTHLCVTVTLGDRDTRKLFDDIIGNSPVVRPINPSDEQVLWQEFKARESHEELDKEIP